MASKLLLMLVLGTVAVTSIVGQRDIGLSGPEIRNLAIGQNPDLLARAALVGESVIIAIDSPEVIAPVQENVNANFWCLPWLQRFPGGSIRWLFQSFDTLTGEPISALEVLSSDATQIIGGEYNEWLNISATILVQGAESPSSGLYQCEVCFINRGVLECHRANTTLQVIGGPPILVDTESNDPISIIGDDLVYIIGSDFCVPSDFMGTITIQCEIFNFGPDRNTSVSRAFPTPDRAWSLNNDLINRVSAGGNFLIRGNPDFFMVSDFRMVIAPDFFVPDVLTSPTGGTNQGAVQFEYQFGNTTMLMTVDMFNTVEEAAQGARQALVGEWTCATNNSFGSDTASSNVRICGAAPSVMVCSSTLFSMDGAVVPVGCTVCIPEGASITLNCSATSDSEVTYEWRNSADLVVSTSPLFTTGTSDSFTCTATNLDNAPEISASVIAYSDTITFTATTTEEFRTTPLMGNGCSRLSDQTGLEDVSICAFVGETVDFSCTADDSDMTPLAISDPGGAVSTGSLRVADITPASEGTYQCRLSSDPGPCAQATVLREVQVFDPATISRTSVLPLTCIGAGRPTGTVFQPVGSTATLCCPYNGIEEPTRNWFRIEFNEAGCATEVLVMESDGVMIMDPEDANILTLVVPVSGPVTYVCRVSNRAGSDADIVSLETRASTFSWSTTDFSACDRECRDGVRTRSVVCRSDIDNMVVPDFECAPTPAPADTMSCAAEFPDLCLLDPAWFPEEWSQCSKDCGGGHRERRVYCRIPMTGLIVSNALCSTTQPSKYDTQGCKAECCIRDENPIFCKNTGPSGCTDLGFQKECCWTCGLKIVGRG